MTHAKNKTSPKVTRPTRHMMAPLEEFGHLFAQLKSPEWMHSFNWPDAVQPHIPMFTDGKVPKIDIIDNDNDLLIRAELPGVDKKDLDISMIDNRVTIKASTSYEDKEEKGNYYRSEITQGEYCRTLTLPADVDIEHAETSFKNGVLELTVPKVEHSQRRTIKVE